MYSPLQHHNPKRKMNDMATKQVRGDHNLSRALAEDNSGIQLMGIPKVHGPASVNTRQSRSMVNKQQFTSARDLPGRQYNQPDTQSYKPKNERSMAPEMIGNKKPNSYRDGYTGNKAGGLSRSPSHQRLSGKNDTRLKGYSPQKGSLGQRQGSAEQHNVLALPSPFDNSAANNKLPPPLPGSHRR